MSVKPSQYEPDDLYIQLVFTEESGKLQSTKRTVHSRLGPVKPGDDVEIIYLSGTPDRARLVAEQNFLWPVIFFGMIGIALLWMLVTYRRMEAGKS